LPAVIRDEKVRSRAHLGRVLWYLTQFEMRNPAVNANIADAVEQFSLLAFATPGAQKFSYPVALFSLLITDVEAVPDVQPRIRVLTHRPENLR
jgi:hypothetical protein